MKTKYHIQITQNILQKYFSQAILDKIIRANVQQDRIKNQFGHDYIHFDGSAFSEGFSYIKEQESIIIKSIEESDFEAAWAATGRILHNWQDFYSHSNYVQLWYQYDGRLAAEEIDHKDLEIINSPALQSGKNYGLMEFFAMIPGFSRLITPLMPEDSHTKMNLDSPKSGHYFKYAYIAAEKRTQKVIEALLQELHNLNMENDLIQVFLGK